MCCFSRTVPFVGDTRVFARASADGAQYLAYAMTVDLPEALAMVLPLPVPVGTPDDGVEFIDLSGYPKFFDDLAKAFPAFAMAGSRGPRPEAIARQAKLAVVDVGAFEASFVPSVRDFDRLDARFRLPDSFFEALPRYADWGFAVFRLKPNGDRRRQAIHPMALRFPRREARGLYFPTVHMHDGAIPDVATFDHMLYAQVSPLLAALMKSDAPMLGFHPSTGAVGDFVDARRDRGLTEPLGVVHRAALNGELTNADTWLTEPRGLTVDALAGRGAHHAWEIRASHAYLPGADRGERAAWQKSARDHVADFAKRWPHELAAALAELGRDLRLAPLPDDLPPYRMNGPQVRRGTWFIDGQRGSGRGPGVVRFAPFTDRIEPQHVRIAFEAVPDDAQAARISEALTKALERALPS
jgi:hypothetical protein